MNSGQETMSKALGAGRRALAEAEEVPVGYKRTEVGVIPEDWRVVSAFDACSKIQDGTHFSPQTTGSDYLYVTSKNIRFGRLDISTASWIDSAQHQAIYRRCDVKKGDLLLTKDGANTGNAALNTLEDEFSLLSSVAFLRFNLHKHCAAYFLQQILTSQGQRQIQDAMAGNAITRLTLEKINKLRFPVPPTKAEQEAIAEALSDVDGLLAALEALIAKKRAVKQATMQQLLTGKTRLPGFSGKWETTTVGEVADIRNGATPSTQVGAYWNGPIPWCTPTDITATLGKYLCATERSVTAAGLANCAASLLPVGALLLCSRATIGEIKIAASSVCTNQGFKSLVCKDGVSNEFLYYLLLTLKPQMIERAIGSTFLEIGKRDVASIELCIPTYAEQHAIAAVLSDMDAEIAALEAHREKTCAVKQGMMQQLLTGRVRLVEPKTITERLAAPRSAEQEVLRKVVETKDV